MTATLGRAITKAVRVLTEIVRNRIYRYLLYSWFEIGKKVVFSGPLECLGVTGTIRLGDRCYVGPWVSLSVSEGGRIEIGANVSLNKGSVLSALSRVHIGAGCRIGEYVSIRDNDHRISSRDPIRTSGFVTQPIHIGDNVWIGRNVTILPGVVIGDGAIVGANSLVNRNVDAYSVVFGTPARYQRTRDHDS